MSLFYLSFFIINNIRKNRKEDRYNMTLKETALNAIEMLKIKYPDAICSLVYSDPFELLVATRLSAQCTDARVNMVTPALFERFKGVDAFAEADVEEVGTYCLVDMEKWLSNLGYEITDYKLSQPETFSMYNNNDSEEKVSATTQNQISLNNIEISDKKYSIMNPEEESKYRIDVVFNLNNNVEGLSSAEFQNIKTNIELIGKALFYETKDVRIYVLD